MLPNLIIHGLISVRVHSISRNPRNFDFFINFLVFTCFSRNKFRWRNVILIAFKGVCSCNLGVRWLDTLKFVKNLNILLLLRLLILLGISTVAIKVILVYQKIVIMFLLWLIYRGVVFRNAHVVGVGDPILSFDNYEPLRTEWCPGRRRVSGMLDRARDLTQIANANISAAVVSILRVDSN